VYDSIRFDSIRFDSGMADFQYSIPDDGRGFDVEGGSDTEGFLDSSAAAAAAAVAAAAAAAAAAASHANLEPMLPPPMFSKIDKPLNYGWVSVGWVADTIDGELSALTTAECRVSMAHRCTLMLHSNACTVSSTTRHSATRRPRRRRCSYRP